MDFYAFLAVGALIFALGYGLGYKDRQQTRAVRWPSSPDNPQDLISNLQGQVAAHRMVMQKWADAAKDLGFDGVASALASIKTRQHVTLHFSANCVGKEDDMAKIVSMVGRNLKGKHQ